MVENLDQMKKKEQLCYLQKIHPRIQYLTPIEGADLKV